MKEHLKNSFENANSKHLNNNYLVVGSSGTGKTTLFVDSQIRNAEGSIVVADTKSNLYKKYRKLLIGKGYKVHLIDFIDLSNSTIGYNPLDCLVNRVGDCSPRELESIANLICPFEPKETDPFWRASARMVITAYLAFYLELFGQKGCEKNLRTFSSIISDFRLDECYRIILDEGKTNTYVGRCFKDLMTLSQSEKTLASIWQFVTNSVKSFDTDEMVKFFTRQERFNTSKFAGEKTALFLNISDNDRTNDSLIGMFYTQLFQRLISIADKNSDGKLAVPVNIILDDFATNAYIDGFANIISVIRSRGISVSIMLQGLSQLQSKYNYADAQTIINNCDRCWYLGSNDYDTMKYFSLRADRPISELLSFPLDSALYFERGVEPKTIVKKYQYEI